LNDLHDDISDVPGVTVGHYSDLDAKTGVTVVLPPGNGIPAGVFVGGNAVSTRQADSLGPFHVVDRIHAVCLSGGSAFGLDASGGVMATLESRGIGIPVVGSTVPIVPTAAVFDLNVGDGSVRPDREMGRQACESASDGPVEMGSVGAGTGASVGKLFGIAQGMKGGLGSASTTAGNLVVGALVVVNAWGDIFDIAGRLIAGCRIAPDSLETADATKLLTEGTASTSPVGVENTTLAVVAVNAKLNKLIASRIAAQATLGLSSVIRPFHSHIDGDITFVLSVGEEEADFNRIGLMAGDALRRAVVKAIKKADGFGLIPAYRDLPY
jgi:L-aminopeptidase/D-esterase-like protein